MKEKKIKILWSLVMVMAIVLWGWETGYAAVSGVCSGCHTMHNSQAGAAMGTTTNQSALLLNDCLGCHTTTGSEPFDNTTGYPYVRSTTGFSDDNCLAGGFFPVTAGTGNNNDNHHGIGNTSVPAGFDGVETTWYTGVANGLSCAGTNGCHGNETVSNDMAAISGGHHNPTGAYRILSVNGTDVVGYGAADYEELIIKTPATAPVTTVGVNQNVNHYSAGATDVTISELCAKCHGDFHGTDDVGSSGAWTRHPTDNAIPTSWAIGSTTYAPVGADYKNNPVGYASAAFDITAKKVTCLSCHRAHGTDNADLLRWAYSEQSAGNSATYGCLGCHNKQR